MQLEGIDTGSAQGSFHDLSDWISYRPNQRLYDEIDSGDEEFEASVAGGDDYTVLSHSSYTTEVSNRRKKVLLGCCCGVIVVAGVILALAAFLALFIHEVEEDAPLCHPYDCSVKKMTRPALFDAAMASANITGLDGGISLRVAGIEDARLWIFGNTSVDVRCGSQRQQRRCAPSWVPNTAALVRTDGDGTLTFAAFPTSASTVLHNARGEVIGGGEVVGGGGGGVGGGVPPLIPKCWASEGALVPRAGLSTTGETYLTWVATKADANADANASNADGDGDGDGDGDDGTVPVAWGVGNISVTGLLNDDTARAHSSRTHRLSSSASGGSDDGLHITVHRFARDINGTHRADWPIGAVLMDGGDGSGASALSIINVDGAEGSARAVLGTSSIDAMRAAWKTPIRYWNGSSYGPLSDAVGLFDVPGGSISCLYHPRLHYACIMPDAQRGNVVLRTADRLEGPWSREYHVLDTGGGPRHVYWHPELGKTNRTLVFSYCGMKEYNVYFAEITFRY